MGSRVHPDNILWVCCCCGGLPIIALIKVCLLIVPIFTMFCVTIPLITIICWPFDVFLTIYAVGRTKHMTLTPKILALMLLPVALITWPIFVLIIMIFVSTGVAFFYPFEATMDESKNLITGGFTESIENAAKFIKEFWQHNTSTYFQYCLKLAVEPVAKPFDIKLHLLIIAIFVESFTFITIFISFVITGVIFIVPVILKTYWKLWSAYFSSFGEESIALCLFMFIPFVLANVFIPIGAVLAFGLALCLGAFQSLQVTVMWYKEGVKEAFKGLIEVSTSGFEICVSYIKQE